MLVHRSQVSYYNRLGVYQQFDGTHLHAKGKKANGEKYLARSISLK